MALCSTNRWVSTSPYVTLTVTVDSQTATTATLKYVLTYTSQYAASTTYDKSYTITVNGSKVATGSYDISGKYKDSPYTIKSGTVSITKGTSAKTIGFSVSFAFNLYWSDVYAGTLSASGSISVAAKTSYKVTFNANGGSGAPSAQTKWHGTALTLSTTKPTRTGYTFLGWSTSSTATSATWAAGGSYTTNASDTLYAVWKAITYTVTFNANGGTGAPSNQTKTYGKTLTLSGTKPTRTNYTFLGWATSASATTAAYAAGGSYTANANITLYAVWSLAYKKPTISNYSVSRCDSSGVETDDGTYALVTFNWATTYSVSEILIAWVSASSTDSLTISASGTSGSVSKVVGSGALSTEAAYTIRVTVTDSGGTWTVSKSLPGLIIPLDLLNGGGGISFGKPAELDGYADIGYKTMHRSNMYLENNLAIYGYSPSGAAVHSFQPQNTNGNCVIGYGNYANKEGNTNIYGHDVTINVSNAASNVSFSPYRRQGHTVTFSLRTAGYVTTSGKDVTFLVPFAVPIIGSPTATAMSASGFTLRQDEKYTHGSSASSYTFPDSYTAYVSSYCGVYVIAHFTDTTNVINNAPIGIYWSGSITFA